MRSRGSGRVYVVATPIGNLEDVTLRALKILRQVSWIVAEDTRTTRKLLSAHDIRTPMVSYHEQGETRGRVKWILKQVREGKNVALVSEAGTPGISDPGYELIREAITSGIELLSVPGPSAPLAALPVSGLPMDRFVFEGFLPRKRSQRRRTLGELAHEPRTLIFFESPRRLKGMLADMLEVLGDRRAALARELTKMFEQCVRGHLSDLLSWASEGQPRGEITVIVEGASKRSHRPEQLHARIRDLRRSKQRSDRELLEILKAETGLARKEIYRALLDSARTRDSDDHAEPD